MQGRVVSFQVCDPIHWCLFDTCKLDTDAVTTIKIADGQVTPAKLSASVGNTFFPIGGIIMWSGVPSTIPANWRLCDGNNGTPDLRGKFVVGGSATGGYGTFTYKSGDGGNGTILIKY